MEIKTPMTYLAEFHQKTRYNHKILRRIQALEDKAIKTISNMDMNDDDKMVCDNAELNDVYDELNKMQKMLKKYDTEEV